MERPNYKRSIGVAVVITNEYEFNRVKEFLSPEILYLNWHKNMLKHETAITLKANKNCDFSVGGVGCAEYKKECGMKIVPFNENLAQYIV